MCRAKLRNGEIAKWRSGVCRRRKVLRLGSWVAPVWRPVRRGVNGRGRLSSRLLASPALSDGCSTGGRCRLASRGTCGRWSCASRGVELRKVSPARCGPRGRFPFPAECAPRRSTGRGRRDGSGSRALRVAFGRTCAPRFSPISGVIRSDPRGRTGDPKCGALCTRGPYPPQPLRRLTACPRCLQKARFRAQSFQGDPPYLLNGGRRVVFTFRAQEWRGTHLPPGEVVTGDSENSAWVDGTRAYLLRGWSAGFCAGGLGLTSGMGVLRVDYRAMMTRAAVYVLSAAIVLSAALLALVPRYELQTLGAGPVSVRLDRWTGRVSIVVVRRGAADTYEAVVRPAGD
jgi:hypothetical protein